MGLAEQIAKLSDKVNGLFDLVKGQFNKWDGQVKAQINKLDDWKKTIYHGIYRIDFKSSVQGRIFKVKATPYKGVNSGSYDLVKLRSQADWSFNQIFITIRRYSHSPTSETIYRLDNYYDNCTLTIEKDGGCNILELIDNGVIGKSSNDKDVHEWILKANLSAYTGYDIDMEFTQSLGVTDYRNPLGSTAGDIKRGAELLSNLKVSED